MRNRHQASKFDPIPLEDILLATDQGDIGEELIKV